MTVADLALGLSMGMIAALGHLGLTWIRAWASLRGRATLGVFTFPLAIAMPAIILFAAFESAPARGGMALVGYALLRSFTMAYVVRL